MDYKGSAFNFLVVRWPQAEFIFLLMAKLDLADTSIWFIVIFLRGGGVMSVKRASHSL